MTYRKVYVARPMDHSVVAVLRALKGLGLDEGEYQVAYQSGLSALYVVAEKACLALDGLLELGILNQEDAWNHFIAAPVQLH